MDFFESQAVVRRRTVLLVVYYLLAALVVIPLVYFVVLGIAVPLRASVNFFREWYDFHDAYTPVPHPGWWDATLFSRVACITLLLMLGGTLYRLRQVTKGGYVVAELLGGRRVDPGTKSPAQKRLLNVVAEMAIACGLPVPDVYLLASERGINAFAAGFTPDDAVIGVTQGCIETLSRDELQAVVAHEFSHILYGDTRLKTLLVGLLHGLVYLGFMSNQACLRAAKGEPAMVVTAFFVFVVLGVVTLPLLLVTQIGIALAGGIKRMVSRQREFLADAAAVQFTRNPDSVADALRKIGGYVAGSCILSSATGQASHLFFADALRRSVLRRPGLSSHPTLTDRIRRVDPGFSGTFAYVPSQAVARDKAGIA